jgi:hypothetical protein
MSSYYTNRVFRVMVTGSVAPTATTIGTLANGEINAFKRDGTLATATDIANYRSTGDSILIAIGGPGGNVIQKTDLFSPRDIIKSDKQAYAAEVQKVVTVSVSGVAAPTAFYEYSIIINEVSDHDILQTRQARKIYTVVATATDTNDTIMANLVLAINNDPFSIVTASYTASLLTLTGKDTSLLPLRYITGEFRDQNNFEVQTKVTTGGPTATGLTNYVNSYGVIANPTPIGFGEGTYRHVYGLERISQTYKGSSNFTSFPQDSGEYFSVPGTTYTTRVIMVNKTFNNNTVSIDPRGVALQSFTIFFPVGSLGLAQFDLLFSQASIGSSTIDDA